MEYPALAFPMGAVSTCKIQNHNPMLSLLEHTVPLPAVWELRPSVMPPADAAGLYMKMTSLGRCPRRGVR
jgi:hypothetical protein